MKYRYNGYWKNVSRRKSKVQHNFSYIKSFFNFGSGIVAVATLEILAAKYLTKNPIAISFVILLSLLMFSVSIFFLLNLKSQKSKYDNLLLVFVVFMFFMSDVTVAVLARPLINDLALFFFQIIK